MTNFGPSGSGSDPRVSKRFTDSPRVPFVSVEIACRNSAVWRLYVNMDCPLAERLHEESQYGSWHSGAVTFAVQHAQVGAPRTHGRPILVRHDSGDLVQVREVVSCPCR